MKDLRRLIVLLFCETCRFKCSWRESRWLKSDSIIITYFAHFHGDRGQQQTQQTQPPRTQLPPLLLNYVPRKVQPTPQLLTLKKGKSPLVTPFTRSAMDLEISRQSNKIDFLGEEEGNRLSETQRESVVYECTWRVKQTISTWRRRTSTGTPISKLHTSAHARSKAA